MVGLGNVDNTSDLNKPVSTAVQSSLDLKANIDSPTFTGTVSGVTKSMVGLGNVDNTSDADKPVSTAQQSALDLKANINSPAFTGDVSVSGSFNTGVTLSTNSVSTGRISVRSSIVNLKTVQETSIFTVPSGYMFLIDTMEIVTTEASGSGSAPTVRFGNAGEAAAYYGPSVILSDSVGTRHVIEHPQNGVVAGTVVTMGVTVGSTLTNHSGVGIVTGYLLKIS
jgi:hypothetical protein